MDANKIWVRSFGHWIKNNFVLGLLWFQKTRGLLHVKRDSTFVDSVL